MIIESSYLKPYPSMIMKSSYLKPDFSVYEMPGNKNQIYFWLWKAKLM